MPSRIGVCCSIGKNAVPYAEHLRCNLLQTARFPERLAFYSVHNEGCAAVPDGFKQLATVPLTANPSMTHAQCLNHYVQNPPEELTLFADVDVVTLRNHWDSEMENGLAQYSAIGVSYGGTERGYQGFPNAIFLLTKSDDLRRANPDFSPVLAPPTVARFVIRDEEESRLHGVPIGTQLKHDTGWALPKAYYAAGLNGLAWRWEKRGAYVVFSDDRGPIVTHMTCSRTHSWDGKFAAGWRSLIAELRGSSLKAEE